MYLAIINTPGYLSNQDELPGFETMAEAWRYLHDERERDLGDPVNDEDDDEDQCLEEIQGLMECPELGTVYGPTPGYDGDHDLGVAYSVIRSQTTAGQPLDWATQANKPYDQGSHQ